MSQALAAGKLPQSKYGELPGFTATPMIAPLGRMFCLVCGPPGDGKSTFCQSNPNGYTINLDLSSTSRYIKGTIWPGVDPKTGRPIDNHGDPVFLSWDKVLEIVNQLIAMAEQDLPRPETIYFDSIDGLIPLMITHLVEINDKDSWQDMDGRRMWGILYDLLVQTWNRLRCAGYGVYIIGHIIQTKIPIGDDKYHVGMDFTFGDGLWKRIEWALEMIAGVEVEERTVTRMVKQKPVIIEGITKTLKDKEVSEKVRVYVFSTHGGEADELLKQRVNFSDSVTLPEEAGWAKVETAYKKAIKPK